MSGNPDISYAEIKYYVSDWNYEVAQPYSLFYEIGSHNCTREELGLTGDHSKFMPIREKSKAGLESLSESFVCLDTNDVHLHGQVGSVKGRILHMAVIRCYD